MIEKAAGKRYDELLQERVLDPLGMTSTHVQLVDGPAWAKRGHRKYSWRIPLWHFLMRPKVWRFDAYAPCGAMASTLSDLAGALRGFGRRGHVVAKALELSAEPLATIPGGKIGMAWYQPAGDEWIWHNGATFGHAAYLGVSRHRGVGVAIVCNQFLAAPVTELGHQLMRQLHAAS